jgi:hypothetical protein
VAPDFDKITGGVIFVFNSKAAGDTGDRRRGISDGAHLALAVPTDRIAGNTISRSDAVRIQEIFDGSKVSNTIHDANNKNTVGRLSSNGLAPCHSPIRRVIIDSFFPVTSVARQSRVLLWQVSISAANIASFR